MPLNFEFPREPKESLTEEGKTEPRLRYVDRALDFLKPEEEGPRWKELAASVAPYEDGFEFTENIRDVVRGYVASKIPDFKERASSIDDMPDAALLNALTNNWFEELENEDEGRSVEGQRREVLLMTMAHVVRRIENYTYKQKLKEADEQNLEKLGLNTGTRDLLIDVMDASAKADPLFIRFVAYNQLAGKPGEAATPEGFTVPGADATMTVAALFPRETQFLAKRFDTIADGNPAWEGEPGADAFKLYMKALADYYREGDPTRATALRNEGAELYRAVVEQGFPILVTSGFEGYYKEPYVDPEIKVSVATPDARKEEESFKGARDAMADSLGELDAEQFAGDMKKRLVRSTNVFGAYGVNLSFNAVAQEQPAILLFLNEQIRTYDREFSKYVSKIEGADGLLAPDRKEDLERMSRMITMLHEFSHGIHPDGSAEAKRLGREPLTIIDEVKAETLYRTLVPTLVEKGALEGTSKEWAQAMLASSMQVLEQQPEDDPYFYADSYLLNTLSAEKAIELRGNKVIIKDYDAYWRAMKGAAGGVLKLYRDEAMTERTAGKWIKEACAPDEYTKQIVGMVKNKKS